MKNKNHLLFVVVFFNVLLTLSAQTIYYVDQADGSDSNNGISVSAAYGTFSKALDEVTAGDTIEIIGTYTNPSYNASYTYTTPNDAHLWHAENTIRINNLNGSAGNYITIKAHDNTTVLKGDGANIFRVTNSSYLKILDFNIEGEVERIPLSTANALQFVYLIDDTNLLGTATSPNLSDIKYRNEDETNDTDAIVEETDIYTDISNDNVNRPTYIDTRGLYVSTSNNIEISGNIIHHTPGGGMRVSDSKYVDILNNEIYRCSAKSYTGTHGLVVTKTEPIPNSGYSINILRNKVYNNYNEQYSWSPSKTIITPRIDEGKGISLQRNNTSNWLNGTGRILVANNLCYWNGFSGVHSNDGNRIDFINNTCYLNSYTNTVTYAGQEQKGNNIGISAQGGNDIKIINNISVIDTDWNAFAISSGGTTNLEVSDNMIFGFNGIVNEDSDVTLVDTNTVIADPLFVNPSSFDFGLQPSSTAIGAANISFAPADDFSGNLRDANPDFGALEYTIVSGTTYVFDGVWTPENPSGVSTSNDIINVISGNASSTAFNISEATEANSLNISAGAKLVINTAGSITVQNFDNQGTLTIRSNSTKFGTFITNNIINNGIIDYRRYVNESSATGNDLISAPLSGEAFGDFAQYQSNESAIANNLDNTSQKLFGPFDKTTNTYLTYNTSTTDADIILESGIGYRSGSQSSSNNIFVFTGNLEVGAVNIPIVTTGTSFSEWNLIGNPYTANLDFEMFFNTNKSQFNQGAFQAIYGYNASTNRWTIWNQLTILDTEVTELIVPGQGFFVSAKPDNGVVLYTPAMRKTGTSDDFVLNRTQQNTNLERLKLAMTYENEIFNTDIYFLEGQTRGLDVGYDAAAFNDNSNRVFTHLVEDNSGIELAKQTLPNEDITNVVVALGVKANEGVQFSIGIDNVLSTIEEDTFVYLEDTETNIWTLLNNSDYILTPNTDITGVGRFYLHFQANILSVLESSNNSITIFTSGNDLNIRGLLNSSTNLKIYDLLGRKSLEKLLPEQTSQNSISLNGLAKGVYIVNLENDTAKISQKIIVK